MDVVYIVKPGEKNESLRYSLRSLVNLTHHRVWISGYKPSWVDGVGHIPTGQHRDKHTNSTVNVRAACESADVSDPFVLFNDDFFVMTPDQQAPKWHRGLVADMLRRHPNMAGQYRTGGGATLHLLHQLGYADPYSYELHVPIVVDKSTMLRGLDLGRDIRTLHKRTLYGNLAALGGVGHADVKVDGNALPDESWPFWSTTDASFRYGQTGDLIRSRFPAPSMYEVTDLSDQSQEGAVMPVYVNLRTGALTPVADPADIKGKKAATHARRTIERLDRSRRWRRATQEEIDAAKVKRQPTPEPHPMPIDREDGIHPAGGGWYEVVVDGETVDKVRGSDAAQQVYDERS